MVVFWEVERCVREKRKRTRRRTDETIVECECERETDDGSREERRTRLIETKAEALMRYSKPCEVIVHVHKIGRASCRERV